MGCTCRSRLKLSARWHRVLVAASFGINYPFADRPFSALFIDGGLPCVPVRALRGDPGSLALIDDGNELVTPRLHLRWMTADDAGLLLAIWNDPAFMLHVGDRGVRTLDEAVDAFHEGPGQLYCDYGYGPYRVALKETD